MSNLIFKHDVVDNLDSDLSDKPLSARMGKYLYRLSKHACKRYSEKEQWTGDYWLDGKKIYMMTVPEFLAKGNANNAYINNLNSDDIQDIWIDLQNSYWCRQDGGGNWEYRLLANSSSNFDWVIETMILKLSPHPAVRVNLAQGFSGTNYFKVTVRYTKK